MIIYFKKVNQSAETSRPISRIQSKSEEKVILQKYKNFQFSRNSPIQKFSTD